MKFTPKQIAAAVGLATAASTASALPLQQLWFSQISGFESSDGTAAGDVVFFDDTGTSGFVYEGFGSAVTTAGAPDDVFDSFFWSGRGNDPSDPYSGIRIDTFSSDNPGIQLKADFTTPDDGDWNAGDWHQISEVTQINEILSLGTDLGFGGVPDPLWIADALANLRIFDQAVLNIGDEVLLDSTTDRISFWESRNRTSTALCEFQNGGSSNPLGTLCDDVFRVAESSFDPIGVTLDGYRYTFNFALVPGPSTASGAPAGTSLVCGSLNVGLPGSGCENLSQADIDRIADGDLLVFTPEASPGTSSIQVFASFSVSKIPAPSVLALMGIGLAGFGLRANRKRKGA